MRYTADSEHSRFYYILRGILSSLLITVPIFLLLSLALHLTEFPEEYLPPAVFATVVLSIVASGFLSTVHTADKGWFNGAIVGFIYMLTALIIRWKLEGGVSLNADAAAMLITGVLLGTVSGMAGLNIGLHLRRKRNNAHNGVHTRAHNGHTVSRNATPKRLIVR